MENFVNLWEPPDADPHVRWCERSGACRPLLLDTRKVNFWGHKKPTTSAVARDSAQAGISYEFLRIARSFLQINKTPVHYGNRSFIYQVQLPPEAGIYLF